ncbi:MAG: WcaI family glycosyltransferase [Verrucomicrobia bacterium]|nr:WcaI family glycosyltransferase [Verrucomicrobiota bacterium]
MKILVWGINYAPELTGIAPCNVALCECLRAHGHDARMLTTFAYYPNWKKLPADRGRIYRDDVLNGVPVHRCWHYVPARVSAPKRILHEGSFVLSSAWRALSHLPRPDVLVVVSPPLLLGAAAWTLTRLWGGKTPFVFHVQDLQPDAAVGLGMLKPSLLTRALYGLEAFAYRQAARVSGISQGMLRAFAQKGVPEKKRVLFPNGLAPLDPATLPARGQWRARHGFAAEDFLAVYSGNLGVKQGLETVLAAAGKVSQPHVKIVLCGGGAQRDKLAAWLDAHQPANVRLLPLQDDAAYREMMVDTDLALITQAPGTGQFFFPSKLLSALAFARPVLAVADADSELAHAVRAGGFGSVVPASAEPAALAAALDRAATLRASDLQKLADAARADGARFDREKVHAAFLAVLSQVAAEAGGSRR